MLTSLLRTPSHRFSNAVSGKKLNLTDICHYNLDELLKIKDADTPQRKRKLVEDLELFLSTKRETDYREKLETELAPIRLQLAREDRYSELVCYALMDATVGMTADEAIALVNREIKKACASYKYAILEHRGNNVDESELEPLVDDMMRYLTLIAQEHGELIDSLTDKTEEELNELKEQARITNETANQKNAEAQQPFAEHDALKEESEAKLKHHSVIKGKHTDESQVTTLIMQPIEIDNADTNGQTLLDKALQLENAKVIYYVLTYAQYKNEQIAANLIRIALEKIAGDNTSPLNQRKLVMLAAHGCLFDRNLVKKIRQRGLFPEAHTKNHEHADQFSIFFNHENNFIISEALWLLLHAEISNRYRSSSSPKIPMTLWEVLHEKQKVSERFEKLANYFDDAFIHVVTQYKKAAKNHDEIAQKHYMKNVDILLSVIQKYSTTEEQDLRKIAFAIATVLAQDTSSIAVPREGSIIPIGRVTTQQIFFNKQQALKQNRAVPALESSDIDSPTQENLINMLDKTAGSIAEQQAHQKRAIVAYAVFRGTLEYLSTSSADRNCFTLCLSSNTDDTMTAQYNELDKVVREYINGSLASPATMYSPFKTPPKNKPLQLFAADLKNGEKLLQKYNAHNTWR